MVCVARGLDYTVESSAVTCEWCVQGVLVLRFSSVRRRPKACGHQDRVWSGRSSVLKLPASMIASLRSGDVSYGSVQDVCVC